MILLILAGIILSLAEAGPYTGHKLVRLEAETKEQYSALKELHESDDDSVKFWDFEHSHLHMIFLADVAPEVYPRFSAYMKRLGIKQRTTIPDIAKEIRRQKLAAEEAAKDPELNPLSQYQSYNWILNWMSQITTQCGIRCSLYDIGRSHEGRQIPMIKIRGNGFARRSIFIDAGMHSHEWITIAGALQIINDLVNDYGTDAGITSVVNKFDWYITPLVNPDGYELSRSDEALRGWGKTTKYFGEGIDGCLGMGVDLNRNFGTAWAVVGSSDDPCSGVYHGPSAWSELEAAAVRDIVLQLQSNITAVFNLHNPGQYLLHPYAWTDTSVANRAEQESAADAGVAALGQRFGAQYVRNSVNQELYAVGGTAVDWFYEIGRADYVYTWGMQDLGDYGFLIPPELIRPYSQETLDGMIAVANAMPGL